MVVKMCQNWTLSAIYHKFDHIFTVSQSTETAPDHHVNETLILSKDDGKFLNFSVTKSNI